MKVIRINWIGGIAIYSLLVLSLSGAPGDLSSRFDQANKLYEQGKFSEAAQGYESLVNENKVSPAIYFNLGNALFKTSQTGRAIYYYRLAQRLAPRDPDVLANLSFARLSLGGPSGVSSSFIERFLQRVSLNELAMTSAVFFWIWFSLLILGRIKGEWKDDVRPFSAVSGLALVILGAAVAIAANDRLSHPQGVVTAREAVIRFGPLEESQSAYTLRGGAEFSVIDQKDDWIEIMDRSKRTGWLLRKQAVMLPQG